MKKNIILIFVCLVTFFIYSFKITDVPPGINGDEVGIAHNAALMSVNLTDENNNFLPLFIYAKTSDWKQPVTIYTTAAVFKIFGISFFTLRMTSILFVLLSIIFFYFLCLKVFDLKFFLAGTLIFITTPIIMIQSHLALENISLLPFILFWLLMLASDMKPKNAFLAGISLGIGIFSYLGMRTAVPVISIITLFYFRNNLKLIFSYLAGVLPFFGLLFVASFYYPGAVVGSYNAPLPSVYDFILRYLSIFDLSFLFLKGDISPYHSTGKVGMFLVSTLPIFLLGIWNIIKHKKPFEILILSSFFLTPILFGFVPDIYRASRLLVLVPLFVIIATVGFTSLTNKFKMIMILLIVGGYWFFVSDYWFGYSKRIENIFPVTINNYDGKFIKIQ